MRDTSPAMEEIMREMIRKKTPQERLKMGSSMYDTSRHFIVRAILEEKPNISESELRKEIFLKFYKDDFPPEELMKIANHLQSYSRTP